MHSKNLSPQKQGFKKALIKKFAELAGIFFSALLVFSAIVYAWSPGPPEDEPGEGNVELAWGSDGTDVFRESGDVGIGTTDPAQKLHTTGNIRADGRHLYLGSAQDIYGDNSSAIYYDSNHSTITQMLFRDAQNTTYGRVYGSDDGANFGLLDGDGNWSYLAAKDNYTQFRVNNSAKMTIRSSGNVGIGTTSPGDARLHIERGSSAISLRVAGGESQFMDGSTYFYISPSIANSRVDIGSFNASSSTNLILNRAGGNVGIGTTAPGAKLEVNGNVIANDPTADNHLATKAYVDAAGGGGSPYIDWNQCEYKLFGPTYNNGTVTCTAGYSMVIWSGTCSGAIGSRTNYCYIRPTAINAVTYQGDRFYHDPFGYEYNYVSGGIKCCKYITP